MKLKRLNELLWADNIVIQCHNDPDADALASGWGLYKYFMSKGKNVRLVYGGRAPVSKKNLQLMTDLLGIPAKYITSLDPEPDLLLTADCQPGQRNTAPFKGKKFAAIDHHVTVRNSLEDLEAYDIRDNFGACSTIVWDLLRRENYDLKNDPALATALYYGLFMDTCKMQELSHPTDRAARNVLENMYDQAVMQKLLTHNLNIDELKIVGDALKNTVLSEKHNYAVAEAAPCDPNILGIISDQINEVDGVDVCVVYSMLEIGAKLSVRSCIPHVQANEVAAYLSGGGGHKNKAGGMLMAEAISERSGNTAVNSETVRELLINEMKNYFEELDIIYAGKESSIDLSDAPIYYKLPVEIGYVRAADIYPSGSKIKLLSLEGDELLTVDDDLYIMIGIEREVYYNKRGYFKSHNKITGEELTLSDEELRYAEDLVCGVDTETIPLKGHIMKCVPVSSQIRAKPLERRVKVFSKFGDWFSGDPGDYIVARVDDPADMYIIRKHIFEKTYGTVN